MNRPRLAALVGLSILIVAACGGGAASPAASSAASPASGTAATLTSGEWHLVEIGVTDAGLEANFPSTATFGTDGTIRGIAGCNTYNGTYTANGAELKIASPLATTMMLCQGPVAAFETAYLAALGKVASQAIDQADGRDRLTLSSSDGKALLRYLLSDGSITDRGWLATGINNGKEAVVSIVEGSAPSLLLASDTKTASGNASCNQFNGSFTLDGDTLSFGPLATTMMACTSDALSAQEQAYLAALGKVKTWALENGVLTLRDESGATQVQYKAD